MGRWSVVVLSLFVGACSGAHPEIERSDAEVWDAHVEDAADETLDVASDSSGDVAADTPLSKLRMPKPVVAAVSPATAASERAITLQGDLLGVVKGTVTVDDVELTVTHWTPTEVVAVLPALADGPHVVKLRSRGGSSEPVTVQVASSAAGPSIRRITPPVAHPGESVTVEGKNFSESLVGTVVTLDGTPLVVTKATKTELTVQVGAAARSGSLVVEVAGAKSNAVTFFVTTSASAITSTVSNYGVRRRDYLSDAPYAFMVVEIDASPGVEPKMDEVDIGFSRIHERIRKKGILFVRDGTTDVNEVWTDDKVYASDARNRRHHHSSNTATYYLQYVTGTNPSGWAGVSYSATGLAIRASDYPSGVEGFIVTHEFGHNLGLVNAGTPMTTPHEDPSGPYHDLDVACVMYKTAPTSPSVIEFDPHCIADLKAAGGR